MLVLQPAGSPPQRCQCDYFHNLTLAFNDLCAVPNWCAHSTANRAASIAVDINLNHIYFIMKPDASPLVYKIVKLLQN